MQVRDCSRIKAAHANVFWRTKPGKARRSGIHRRGIPSQITQTAHELVHHARPGRSVQQQLISRNFTTHQAHSISGIVQGVLAYTLLVLIANVRVERAFDVFSCVAWAGVPSNRNQVPAAELPVIRRRQLTSRLILDMRRSVPCRLVAAEAVPGRVNKLVSARSATVAVVCVVVLVRLLFPSPPHPLQKLVFNNRVAHVSLAIVWAIFAMAPFTLPDSLPASDVAARNLAVPISPVSIPA